MVFPSSETSVSGNFCVVVLLEVLAILLGRRLLLLILGGTFWSLASLPSLADASKAEHDNLGAQDLAMQQPHEEGFGEADAPRDASEGKLGVALESLQGRRDLT